MPHPAALLSAVAGARIRWGGTWGWCGRGSQDSQECGVGAYLAPAREAEERRAPPSTWSPPPPSPQCSSLMSGLQQLAKPPSPADLLGEVSHTRESQEPVPC